MNSRYAGRTLSGLSLCLVLAGCASAPRVISMGDNTYSVTREAGTVFSRDTSALTEKAKQDAANFCAAQGKQLKVIDVMVEKPFPTTGYAKAKVIFQPVAASEMKMAAERAPAAVREAPAPVEETEKPAAPPAPPASEPSPPVAAAEKPAPAPLPAAQQVAPAAVSENPAGFDLYTELLKLDDLRKRGILTEDEFQAEKKKVLARSK